MQTPRIDRLPEEGMQISNYYGGVLRAPARLSLLGCAELLEWTMERDGLRVILPGKQPCKDVLGIELER